VQRYIAVSEANARYLTEQKRLPARKITVIHNGCDIERFDPTRRPPPGLRSELGFAAEDPVLLVLGRLEPQKGHRILLDAMPEVHRRFPRARLVCAGDGTLRGELEAQARSLGLAQVVRFVGYQPDVTPWLALADVSVLPSFYEGLPLAAVESLAAGRPVVATAVDGTPEVVVEGETGLLVSPGDPAGLANALCRLLGDPAGRARLGRAGRARAMDLFDQRQQVRRTQELYTAAQAGVHGTLPAIAGAGAGHGPRIP
jgi:glycosyltransferase involved in cell wall biosynthesis